MKTLQLDPSIPVTTPKGAGQALFVTDYSPEHHLYFTVAIDETGEIWTYDNTKIKMQKNITLGRTLNEEKIDKGKEEGGNSMHYCNNCEMKTPHTFFCISGKKNDIQKHWFQCTNCREFHCCLEL
jgi:hypothetical protein